MMREYQELITEHQELQKQLADKPDAVDIERVLQLVGQVRDAGEHVRDPRRREQLRAILKHWGVFVHERTGELPATQLAPLKPDGAPEVRLISFFKTMPPWVLWGLPGLIAAIIITIVGVIIPNLPQSIPTPTPTAPIETDTPTPTAVPPPTVYLTPSQITLAMGETVTVEIWVDDAQQLNSVRLELSFDSNYIQVEDADTEADGAQIIPGEIPRPAEVALNQTVGEDGIIIYQAAQEPGSGADGSGVIASIVLRRVKEGDSALSLDNVEAVDSEGNSIEIMLPLNRRITVVGGEPIPTPTASPTLTPTPTPTPGPTPTPTPVPEPIQPDNAGRLVPLATPTGHEGAGLQVAFSPDGRFLLSRGADGTTKLWSVADDGGLAILATVDTGGAQAVAFSPDSRWLALGANDGVVVLWRVDGLQTITEFRGHDGFIFDVAFSPDSHLLASGSDDGTARVWDVDALQEAAVLRGHEGGVNSVAFSPDGQWLATGSWDHTVRVWEAATGRPVARMELEDWVLDVAFSPDGQSVATGSRDGTMRVWDISAALDAEATTGQVMALVGYEDWVLDVIFSPDGRWVASRSWDGTARLREVVTGQEVTVPRDDEGGVNSLAFSPDSRILALGSADGSVILWDVTAGQPIRSLTGHTAEVMSVTFSPDGRWLASADADGTIILWGLRGY